MKAVSEITDAMAASMSGLIDSYCAFRSTNGMATAVLDADMETIPLKPPGPFRRADEQRLREACDGKSGLDAVGQVGDLTDDTSRVSDDDGAGGDVADDDRPCADEGVLAHDDAGEDCHVGSDFGAPLNDGTRQLFLDTRRQRIFRIGQDDVRAEPAAFFEHRELGHEYLRVDADVIGNRDVMFDDRQRADAHVVADFIRFADVDLVAGLEVAADDVARIQHRVRADDRSVTDRRWQFPVRRSAWRRADDAEIFDRGVRAEMDVPINPRRAHEASPRRHFFGRKRSCTSMFVSMDS